MRDTDRSRYFIDRYGAGKELGEKLKQTSYHYDYIIGIPCGGIPILHNVGSLVECKDLLICPVSKIESRYDSRFGLGAVDMEGNAYVNNDAVEKLWEDEEVLVKRIDDARNEIENMRAHIDRRNMEIAKVSDSKVLIVDDGIATGYTMLAALENVKKKKAERVDVAVPVASTYGIDNIRYNTNLISLVLEDSLPFMVDSYYEYFPDLDIKESLRKYEF